MLPLLHDVINYPNANMKMQMILDTKMSSEDKRKPTAASQSEAKQATY